jgi:hypothetical protein
LLRCGSPSNTSLNDLSDASAIRTDLTQASDHLPVVTDYNEAGVTLPEPATLAILIAGVVIARALGRDRQHRGRTVASYDAKVLRQPTKSRVGFGPSGQEKRQQLRV